MARAKPKAKALVGDGAGGLTPLVDRRFEAAKDWPIRFQVSKEDADVWFRYFDAECAKRGWSSGGIRQLERQENSGSITVNTGAPGTAQLAVVWERRRAGPLGVRARSCGEVDFAAAEAEQFFKLINDRCQARVTEQFYRRAHLHYNGLAWRGEVWLDDMLRLGPPTLQYQTALVGPRVILVDALLECAGKSDVARAFSEKLSDLSAFLSVVLGTLVSQPRSQQLWTFEAGLADCKVRSTGYFEPNNPEKMPGRGSARPVAFLTVTRPDWSRRGIDGTIDELLLPSDIVELWDAFRRLDADRRRQFLQAASKWQEARAHWGQERTLSFALMVVACEALKPADHASRNHNVYHVVEALLGPEPAADLQRDEWVRAQDIRNVHLHRGEFRSAEFLHQMMATSYEDPTFDQAHRHLTLVTQEALIEWLRRGGSISLKPIERKQTVRRWVKEHAGYLIAAGVLMGFVAGLLIASRFGG